MKQYIIVVKLQSKELLARQWHSKCEKALPSAFESMLHFFAVCFVLFFNTKKVVPFFFFPVLPLYGVLDICHILQIRSV